MHTYCSPASPAIALVEGVPRSVLCHLYADPYIARVGHDTRPAALVDHPAATYLGAYVDGVFAGAFLAIRFSRVEYELHALLRKEMLPWSRDLGHECLAWAFSDPHIQRCTAYVIEGLEKAKNFCLRLGFVYEGRRRDACEQNGKLCDVHILGMTRKDWMGVPQ